MKKKGFSAILIIPIVILILVIGGAFAYKLYSDGVQTKAVEPPSAVKVLPGLQAPTGKPSGGYGGLNAPTPTPTIVVAPPMDAEEALKAIEQDTGSTDFNTLDSESAKL